MIENKKVLYSAIQPSGNLTLGNYIGSLKNWNILNKKYKCFFCVANGHSITVKQDPVKLKENTRQLYAMFIAVGLDPNTECIYCQSDVSEHFELAWILNCFTYIGELKRMTQFKNKSKQNANIGAGLLNYPILMASDILLYQTDLVSIGIDQKQHLELCRTIAKRFNNLYGKIFTIPDAYINKIGFNILSLQNPLNKMSKSDPNVNASIYLLDSKDIIVNKIKKAVTDSVGIIRYSDEQMGVKNLINIYCSVLSKDIDYAMNKFENKDYNYLKLEVANAVISVLEPFQKKYYEIIKEKEYIDKCIKEGKEKAKIHSNKTLKVIKDKIGL